MLQQFKRGFDFLNIKQFQEVQSMPLPIKKVEVYAAMYYAG